MVDWKFLCMCKEPHFDSDKRKCDKISEIQEPLPNVLNCLRGMWPEEERPWEPKVG